MAGSATRWWQHGDQFDWFSAYLADRGLQPQWRGAVVVFTMSLAAVPIVLMYSPTGPDHPLTITMSFAAAACGVLATLPWLIRWPTRRQSRAYTVLVTAAIAASCLAQSDPYAALMGCTTFAIVGGFIAYFHTLSLLIVNLGVAMICAGTAAYRLISATGDIALTGSALLIVVGLTAGVPFGIYSLAHTLRRDLRSSGHDPLTGLLNRRAFYRSAYELMMRHPAGTGAHLVITLIDLDNFKRLNDTHGHAVGDEALMRVGEVLRDTCRDGAVIGRVGGEEFVIADTDASGHPTATAERVRRAIADLPFPVTASIGTAGRPLADTSRSAGLELLDSLVRAADSAMYEAKRAGGDRLCSHTDRPSA